MASESVDLDVDRLENEYARLTQEGERLEERQRDLERERVAVGRRIYEMETDDEYQVFQDDCRYERISSYFD